MRQMTFALFFAVVCTALLCAGAFAWDIYYDSSVMPDDPSLGTEVWLDGPGADLSSSSVQDGVLHLVDQNTATTAYFTRDASLPSGTPVTLETCVMVDSGSGVVEVGTGGRVSVGLFTDHITCAGSTFSVDMTVFHVIRMALQTDNTYQVWLDGAQVFSGTTTSGSQQGMVFGSCCQNASIDSYWDYVGYSLAYIPPQ